MDRKLYQIIFENVTKKINNDRYTRNLDPLSGENLRCIANRDIAILLSIVSNKNKLYKTILERIFLRYIPDVSEIMIDQMKETEGLKDITRKYAEELEILQDFIGYINSGMDFKETCETMIYLIDDKFEKIN